MSLDLPRSRKSKGSGMAKVEARWGPLFALPAILGFIIFAFGPFVASFVLGLTNWSIGAAPKFIGFGNYVHMFTKDPIFYHSIFATVYYALFSIPVGIIVAFFVAILLNQKVRGLSVFRTIYYLPVVVPSIANIMLWIWLFNPNYGLLNALFQAVGLPPSQWIFGSSSAIPSLVLMSTWGVGNTVVIFLAGLQGIPEHLFDAVSVDGGGPWQKFLHVTIPAMTPTIFFNLVLSIIGAFQTFNQAYLMTQGGPDFATYFYVYDIFTEAFTDSSMGYACALSWILFLIIMVLSVIVFRTSRYWVYYEGGESA